MAAPLSSRTSSARRDLGIKRRLPTPRSLAAKPRRDDGYRPTGQTHPAAVLGLLYQGLARRLCRGGVSQGLADLPGPCPSTGRHVSALPSTNDSSSSPSTTAVMATNAQS